MTKFAEELITSLKQAVTHADGKSVPGMRLTTAETAAAPEKPAETSATAEQPVAPGTGE